MIVGKHHEEMEAMEEMECWSVQNHLKTCKKCATQAKREGIEEVEKMLWKIHKDEWNGDDIAFNEGLDLALFRIVALKKKGIK